MTGRKGEFMSEAKWYVVHTYSGYENKVKANIEKTIENRHLEEQILEVRVPMQDVVELKNGVQKAVQKKMFPGYVLIHMIMNDDTWYVVRNTRGVTGFVGPGCRRDGAFGYQAGEYCCGLRRRRQCSGYCRCMGRYGRRSSGNECAEAEPYNQCRAVRPRDAG